MSKFSADELAKVRNPMLGWIVLSVLLFVLPMSGCAGILPLLSPGPTLPQGTVTAGESTPSNAPYDDQVLYRILQEAVGRHETHIDLSRYAIPKEQQDRVFQVFSQVRGSSPSAYLCRGGLSYDLVSVDDGSSWTIRSVSPVYQSESAIEAADRWIAELDLPVEDDFEKIRILHDKVVLSTVYDQAAAGRLNTDDPAFTAEGLFSNGTAVCQGYAEALLLLLNRSGIPAVQATGSSRGISHAWVIVQLGARWYHVDPTWDDPVPDSIGRINYRYFLMSDAQIDTDHVRESTGPECTDESYSWMHAMEYAVTFRQGRFAYSDASDDGTVTICDAGGGSAWKVPFRNHGKTFGVTRGYHLVLFGEDLFLSNYDDSAAIYRLRKGSKVLEPYQPADAPSGVEFTKNLRIEGDRLAYDVMDQNGKIVGSGSVSLP